MIYVPFTDLDAFLAELATAGPNVEAVVRADMRVTRNADTRRQTCWVNASFVRDIGHEGDYQRTITVVRYERFVGELDTGQDEHTHGLARRQLDRITTAAADLNLTVRRAYYSFDRR
jgi:hypothetical protein